MQAPGVAPTPGEWPWQAIATVAAAIIAAIAALIIAYVQNRRSKDVDTKLEKLDEGREALRKETAELDVRRSQITEREAQLVRLQASLDGGQASYKIKTWKQSLKLESDGAGTMIRESDGIIAPQQQDTLRIAFKASVETGSPVGLQEPTVEGLDSAVEPEWKLQRLKDATVNGWIWFRDLRTHANERLGFRATHALGRAFTATKEEMEQAYADADFQRELFGVNSTVPVEELLLVVEFPFGFGELDKRNVSPAVFYGGSEELFWGEMDRLKEANGFKISGREARLHVKNPLRGHQYAIAWVPPPA